MWNRRWSTSIKACVCSEGITGNILVKCTVQKRIAEYAEVKFNGNSWREESGCSYNILENVF